MIRLLVRLLVIVAVSAAAMLLKTDPEHARPPHAAPAVARVTIGPSFDAGQASNLEQVATFISGVEREQIAQEAEAQRVERARAAANVPMVSTRSSPTGCDGHVIPGYILQRESGCDYGAVNPAGCGGASCVGLYQFDLRHFTSGACMGLDWHVSADQDECAHRLVAASGLAPWGG